MSHGKHVKQCEGHCFALTLRTTTPSTESTAPYFTKEFPARAFLGAGTLLFGARFDVQGIAVRR
jgi:hypothetical protein